MHSRLEDVQRSVTDKDHSCGNKLSDDLYLFSRISVDTWETA